MCDKSNNNKIFRCNICNKNYSSNSSLWNHHNKFHKNITTNTQIIVSQSALFCQPIPTLSQPSSVLCQSLIPIKEYKCIKCDMKFKHRQSKFKHQLKCKINDDVLNNKLNLNNNNELIEMKKENDLLKHNYEKMEESLKEIKLLLEKKNKIHPKTLNKINNNIKQSLDLNNESPLIVPKIELPLDINQESEKNYKCEFIDFKKNLIKFEDKLIKYFYYKDQVYFKAKDITKLLDYSDTTQAIRVNVDKKDIFKKSDFFEGHMAYPLKI